MTTIKRLTHTNNFLQNATEQNVAYQEAVTKVHTYFLSINDMQPPTASSFNNSPTGWKELYDDIVAAYEKGGTIANKYAMNLYANLQNYPSNCAKALTEINLCMIKANYYVNQIIKVITNPTEDSPTVGSLVSSLKHPLKDAIDFAKYQIQLLDILIKNISTFKNENVEEVRSCLQTIRNGIGVGDCLFESAKVDLEKLKAEIEKEMKSQVNTMIAEGVGVVLSLVIAGLMVATTIASGGTALPITLSVVGGLLTVGAASLPLILDGVEYKQLVNKLQRTVMEIESYEVDMLLFDSWASDVDAVYNQLDEMCGYLNIIRDEWIGVRSDFIELRDMIEAINDKKGRNLTVEEWETVKKDISDCIKYSKAARENVQKLALAEIEVSTAVITPDMTEAEVSEALANSEKLPYVEYMLTA